MTTGYEAVMYGVREDSVRYSDGVTSRYTDRYKALVHMTTNKLLAVVTRQYKTVQNTELFPAFEHELIAWARMNLKPPGLEDMPDVANVDAIIEKSCEVSHYGEHACVRFRIPSLVFEVGGQAVAFELYIWNSFGSRAIRIGWRALCLLCLNGLVGVRDVDVVVQRHTAGLNVKALVAHVPFFVNAFKLFGDRAIAWQRIALPMGGAEVLLLKFPNASERWMLAMLRRFHEHELPRYGDTLWALVNAVTWWASHDDDTYMRIRNAVKSDNVATVLHERAMRVRAWMDTPYFKAVAGETQPGQKNDGNLVTATNQD